MYAWQGYYGYGVELMQRDDQRWLRRSECFTHQAADEARTSDVDSDSLLAHVCDANTAQLDF